MDRHVNVLQNTDIPNTTIKKKKNMYPRYTKQTKTKNVSKQ